MRLLSLLVLGAPLLFILSSLQAQDDTRFSPFDCREHAEDNAILPDFPLEIVSEIPLPEVSELAVQTDMIDAWKGWSYVENFAFGKDRGGMPMITDLNALHPFFRDKIKSLIDMCEAKGIQLAVVETYRTHAKQHEYKTMGKKYTNSGAGKSKHQYGLAVDLVPMLNNTAVWDNAALWRKVGVAGEKLGLRWGGRWKKPYDPGHFEWTGGLGTSDLHSGELPPVPNADEHYPCLEEDIMQLRKSWTEWELSQSSLSRK